MQEVEQSTNRPRVLIADDHSIVAEGLRSLLEKKYDVIGIVPDGRELLAQSPEAQARRDRVGYRHAFTERP